MNHSVAAQRILTMGIGLWVVALLAAPRAIGSRHSAPAFAAAGLYSAGALICHQRADRSFTASGRPMPVCARCTGLYAGAAIGAPLALMAAVSLAASRARRVALAAALPTLLTWSMEAAGLVHPSNAVRAAAALPLGFAAAWLVIAALAPGPAASQEARAPRGERSYPDDRMP